MRVPCYVVNIPAARSLVVSLRQALAHSGPAVVDAFIDPNEPVIPGHVTMRQATNFAKAMIRGEKDAWQILKNVAANEIRELV